MADATTKSKWAFWLMISAVLIFGAVPSFILVEKIKDYYQFLTGWTPGTLKPTSVSSPPHRTSRTKSAESPIHFVDFSVEAPNAKTVRLAANFTGWEKYAIAMRKETSQLWKVTVPLPQGTYYYAFSVDGQWRPDPRWKDPKMRHGREVSVRHVR